MATERSGEIPVAFKYREGGEDLIVFMHGLGCAKESFDDAFAVDVLRRYSLLALDLPSHGDSARMGFSADLADVADVVAALLRDLPRRRVHLVCHSMGGAVGLVVARALSDLAAFVSVEGNLVAEDCGMVSRNIAGQPSETFVESGFSMLLGFLRTSTESSDSQWAEWLERCDPRGLHALAQSLVDWCDKDKLAGIFLSLRQPSYVYGEYSKVDQALNRLGDVPVHEVEGSGHFPMLDKPTNFYDLIGTIVHGADQVEAPASLTTTGMRRKVQAAPPSPGRR